MSFGYSVGDFVAAANMTYRLIRVLGETKGACLEYQEAMMELGAMQQAFLQVSQMKHSDVIPRATINSASHIVMSAMDIIATFLERSKQYQQKLRSVDAADGVGGSWCKIGWALFKKEELRSLRDSLHGRLAAISTLLAAASYSNPLPQGFAKYRVGPSPEEQQEFEALGFGPQNSDLKGPSESPADTTRGPEQGGSGADKDKDPKLDETDQASGSMSSDDKIYPALQPESTQTRPDPPSNDTSNETQWHGADLTSLSPKTVHELRRFLESTETQGEQRQIKFKDAVGRIFSFPFESCRTWPGIEELIKGAFAHIDGISPLVDKGHYDLIGPHGQIVLPQIWESVVRPGWNVSMHMWPLPETDRAPKPMEHGGLRPPPGRGPPPPPPGCGPPPPRYYAVQAKPQNNWSRAVSSIRTKKRCWWHRELKDDSSISSSD